MRVNFFNSLRNLFPSKEYREYRKMRRKHRRELVKHAKETAEYDYLWLHQSVIMQIRHMHEYYVYGRNVWQSDETRLPIIDQLQHILDLEDELQRLNDDHCGLELVLEGDKVVGTTHPDDFLEKTDKRDARISEVYREIYGTIGENIQCWWD